MMKAVMPLLPFSGLLLPYTMSVSATGPLVHHILVPAGQPGGVGG